MAEALVTQVQREDLPTMPAGDLKPRPSRKPKLKLDLDTNGNPKGASDDDKQESGATSSGSDNRYYGLGKIFSRQYTPTIPKTDVERSNAQSPRGKSRQTPKNAPMTTHDENESEQTITTPSEKKSTLWNSLWSSFKTDKEKNSHNAEEDSESAPSSPTPPQVGSPKGQGKAADFTTAAPPAEETVPQPAESADDLQYDPDALLPPNKSGKKMTLVLDLDETLVHSSFKPVQCDFVLSIDIDGINHKVYVLKRPGVEEFLKRMARTFEIVIFTASLDKYANPLLDLLDTDRVISGRLYREHCTRNGQTYVKDLSRLGRSLKRSMIIDNASYSYAFQMNNGIPILSWFDDPHDTELLDMMPFLEGLSKVQDVSQVLDANNPWRVTNKKLLQVLGEADKE